MHVRTDRNTLVPIHDATIGILWDQGIMHSVVAYVGGDFRELIDVDTRQDAIAVIDALGLEMSRSIHGVIDIRPLHAGIVRKRLGQEAASKPLEELIEFQAVDRALTPREQRRAAERAKQNASACPESQSGSVE